MKKKEYKLHSGALLFFDDMRREPDHVKYSHPGTAILIRQGGYINPKLAARAASRMVGVRVIVSQRRITLECKRIHNADDAEAIATEFVYQLDRILRTRDAEAARRKTAKKEARSNTVVKRTPRA